MFNFIGVIACDKQTRVNWKPLLSTRKTKFKMTACYIYSLVICWLKNAYFLHPKDSCLDWSIQHADGILKIDQQSVDFNLPDRKCSEPLLFINVHNVKAQYTSNCHSLKSLTVLVNSLFVIFQCLRWHRQKSPGKKRSLPPTSF